MAQHKSAVKRNRQNERKRQRNKSQMSRLKTMLKRVRAATTKETGEPALKETTALLDKYASSGLIHKNKAANQKRKLTLHVNRLGGVAKPSA